MQWFYDRYIEADDESFLYTPSLCKQYPAPEEFQQWADALTSDRAAKGRAQEVQALRPTVQAMLASSSSSSSKRKRVP